MGRVRQVNIAHKQPDGNILLTGDICVLGGDYKFRYICDKCGYSLDCNKTDEKNLGEFLETVKAHKCKTEEQKS